MRKGQKMTNYFNCGNNVQRLIDADQTDGEIIKAVLKIANSESFLIDFLQEFLVAVKADKKRRVAILNHLVKEQKKKSVNLYVQWFSNPDFQYVESFLNEEEALDHLHNYCEDYHDYKLNW